MTGGGGEAGEQADGGGTANGGVGTPSARRMRLASPLSWASASVAASEPV